MRTEDRTDLGHVLARGGLLAHLRMGAGYIGLHLRSAMQYRISFAGQILSMLINDGMWLVFWVLYFTRFPVVQGWEQKDVMMLWAVLALGFGLVMALFGNAFTLASLVIQGQLDVYLTMPKNVLLHALMGRMSQSAWGDILFGILVFLAFGNPTPARTLLFLVSGLLSGIIICSFGVIVNSAAFFIGGAQSFSWQLINAMIHFSTYPISIFEGFTRLLLFTVLPAGFLSSIPVRVIRQFDPGFFALLCMVAVLFALLAVVLFRVGLRRYESGNLIQLQG